MPTDPLDPITLAVIQAGLQQVCDEMDLTFSRAAFSPVIAEADGRSDGIYSAEDGSLIAQGSKGLPVFVGVMQFSTRTLIARIANGETAAPEPGDIYIVNDPYLGGTHLMDVRFAMPVWRHGRIFCWLSNTGHWPDTGGAVPGGFSASAISAEQEGLRLPPVKLFKKGVLDAEIWAIIRSNIRVSEQRIGDVKAQASALLVGKERLSGLLDRYGDDKVTEAIARMRDLAARQMRAMIGLIPDGSYAATAFVDSDGVVNEPLKIALSVTKSGPDLTFDFAGSSPPCMGPMNSVRATTFSSVYLAMRHIFPDVPISAGAFDPLQVVGIEGTFLDAAYPRPVSGCAAEVSQRIAEAVFAALVTALPDRVTAAPAGTSGNFGLGGHDPATAADYVMYQISGGGYGGFAGGDGIANGCSTIGISKSPPVEIMEQKFPVIYRRYALHEGSGGAGRHRGGLGLDYEIELLRGTARAMDPEIRAFVETRITELAEATARAYGAHAEVTYFRGYPVTINDAEATVHAIAVAEAVVGPDQVMRDVAPMMGAEDFSYMLNERPGAYIFLGNGDTAMLHHPEYVFDDHAIPYGASWLAGMIEGRMPAR